MREGSGTIISRPRNQLLFEPIELPRHSSLIFCFATVEKFVPLFLLDGIADPECGQIPPCNHKQSVRKYQSSSGMRSIHRKQLAECEGTYREHSLLWICGHRCVPVRAKELHRHHLIHPARLIF